jgi:hypothetical protein
MRFRWILPLAVLLPLRLFASGPTVGARVATITINPGEITTLHLRPEFESAIRMPEEVTSVILGSPGAFKAEHNEGEPEYVYVKPITKEPAQSNLLIATRSGQHVTLELISDGAANASATTPVDFLIEYRNSRSFLIASDSGTAHESNVSHGILESAPKLSTSSVSPAASIAPGISTLEVEYQQQMRINSPKWTKWEGQQIETSVGDIRQWGNKTVISFAIFNSSKQLIEFVPPQVQITGRTKGKKKKKAGKGITSDQLQLREYRLSTTRLEAGGRCDGVVVFDRPNFKESTEKLYLQIAQADQVDRPVVIPLPFTPPIAADAR